jgi:hypothetical protein
MKRIELLINQVRRSTENTDFDEDNNIGIMDEEFIQYFNDAQSRIQSLIIQQHSNVFLVESESTCDGSASYSIPSDAFINNKVDTVEFSSTGDSDDYYVLEETNLKNRAEGSTGSPSAYIRSSGSVILVPKPSSGKVRITYIQRLTDLDKRRGKVSLFQDLSAGSKITVDSTDSKLLSKFDYVTVIDNSGVVKAKNILIDSVSSTIYTTNSSHSLAAGESITSGDYVVGGDKSTTHSDLPEMAERYLLAYCEWKILKRDSSIDSTAAMQELASLEREIVDSYKHIQEDVPSIPLINQYDDWSLD